MRAFFVFCYKFIINEIFIMWVWKLCFSLCACVFPFRSMELVQKFSPDSLKEMILALNSGFIYYCFFFKHNCGWDWSNVGIFSFS